MRFYKTVGKSVVLCTLFLTSVYCKLVALSPQILSAVSILMNGVFLDLPDGIF